jgi:site-specific recombinase XerD
LDDLRLDGSEQTVVRYRTALASFQRWSVAAEQRFPTVADLTPLALRGYRNALQQTRAPSTVNVVVCALRTFCAWLKAQGWLDADPSSRLPTVGRQALPSPVTLDGRAVDGLLREAERSDQAERNVAILQVLLQTGMRVGECAALQWRDLTVGERTGSVTIRAGKGDKARWVPLNLSARHALVVYAAPLLDL